MPRPAKPAVPPPPLRSNPESFSARMEASLLFWEIFASYLDELGQFAEAQASAALAAAAGGDLPPLTGQAGRFLRVKTDGSGVEFRKALALADSADGSDLALTSAGRALLAAETAAAQRSAMGAAPLASPAFTGTPTAPTQAVDNNSTRLATTAFVQAAVEAARFGIGQSWQAPTRSTNVSYQNSTGRTITVAITLGDTEKQVEVSADNATWVVVGKTGASITPWNTVTFPVPPGHYYRTNHFNIWREFA
ncbi:hypothetical protein [Cereibacter changlensis]|uniref:hypothetical protein n=1 Tax=Cereibacter changlensis TaxID=402884 RepID=UPI004033FC67